MHTMHRKPGSFRLFAAFLAGSDRSGLKGEGAHRVFVRTLVKAPLAVLWNRLLAWQERQFMRAEMERLDDRMLKDIGVSRAAMRRELTKPFGRL